MNSTYTLTEGNDDLNRVLLMMQYELGKTLDEQKKPTYKDLKKLTDDERYNNTQKFADNTAVSFRGPDGKRISTATSPKMLKDLPLPANTMTLDEFMEGYRDVLTHPVMVGLEVVLTSSGYGVTAVVAAYTALLAYDVYKGVVNEDWDWLNIVFDILGIVSSGVISGTLRPIMKGAQGLKLNSLGKVLTYLSKTKIWSEIKPLLQGGINILKSISKGIKKALLWISKKTGFKSIEYAGVSVETWVKKIVYDIEEFLKSSVKKTVKFLEPGANIGTKTAIKRGLVAATLTQGLKNLNRYLNVKIPKWKNTDREDELTPLIISENPEIYGKNVKFTDVDKDYGIESYYLRDGKGNFYVYDIATKKYKKVTSPEEIEEAKIMFITRGAYSKIKFNDFEVDKYDKNNTIFTINGVDYKAINDKLKLKKI
jgi:hypothetical protein